MSRHARRAFAAVAVAALIAGLTAATAAAQPKPDRYILPGNLVFPEGVVADQSSGLFYVSSTTDGSIFRGHVSDPLTEVWLPGGADGRTTAIGLELDPDGRLIVAGGGTGSIWAYDTADGSLVARFVTPAGATFINDVAAVPSGDVFATDSIRPILWRLPAGTLDAGGGVTVSAEPWLDFTGTPLVYQAGFNVNGIAASEDGKYLVLVQSNTGKLFRVTVATKEVVEIDLGGATVMAGDGLVLRGSTLWVVRNSAGVIERVQLSEDLTEGRIVRSYTDPTFGFPTTADILRGRMLVVNSQFNRRATGDPVLPFTVSSIRVP
jgi:Cu-Zn family superoxide dismutase